MNERMSNSAAALIAKRLQRIRNFGGTEPVMGCRSLGGRRRV